MKYKKLFFILKIQLILILVLTGTSIFPIMSYMNIKANTEIKIDNTIKQVEVSSLATSDFLKSQFKDKNFKVFSKETKTEINVEELKSKLIPEIDFEELVFLTEKEILITTKDGEIKKEIYDTNIFVIPELSVFKETFENELDNLEINSNSIINIEEKEIISDIEEEIIENSEKEKDTETIIQEAESGQKIIFSINEEVFEKTIKEPKHKIIEKGTKEKEEEKISTSTNTKAPAVPSDSVWDQLAFCESGGNWSVNTGNGYYGGVQFSEPTWNTASKKVGLNIAYAHLATREEQILAATWLQENSGWGQWPSCSKKLGLL